MRYWTDIPSVGPCSSLLSIQKPQGQALPLSLSFSLYIPTYLPTTARAMRKGTKRKATQKAAPKSKDQKNEPSQSPVEETKTKPSPNAEPETEPSKIAAGKGGRKRAKVASPEAETEYFPEKSNLEDLWLQVFPVGTEWDMLDKIYQYKWNFSNLKEALEEGGELHNKKVYIFCSTEAQFDDDKGQSQMTIIPVVVVVVSPFPPSDKIGIASVQRENEQIVPMKQMKMDWVPYIPLENRESQVERLKNSQIFILSCNQRRAGLKHLKIERLKMFEYCLPYFYNPLQEDELEQSTVVDLIFPMDPMPIVCEFDWELDELEEFTDQLIEAEELPEDQKETFKDYVKQKVREGKKANREEREARKKAREALSQQSRAAFENIKFYKFYPVPTPDTPDISKKSDIINRYYRKAHKVI